MAALLEKFAKAFPAAAPTIESAFSSSGSSSAVLRQQIQGLRTQYWIRKIREYPNVIRAAKPEAEALLKAWRTPGEFTGRDVAVGAVWAIHIYGAWCLGEVIGRGSFVGYDAGKRAHH